MPRYTSEQFWKLYDKLPQELKDAVFAEETGDAIYDVCKKNETMEYLFDIVEYVGRVLLGVLPPEEFQEILEKEVKLPNETAKKVSREIYRQIFYPVKVALESLYTIKTASPTDIPTKPGAAFPEETKMPAAEPEPAGPDVYREPVE